MMFNYPFFSLRNRYYPYRYYNYPVYKNTRNTSYNEYKSDINNKNKEEKNENESETLENRNFKSNEQFFSILGIKLYFDDLIILALLFFLYNEGVKDEALFICLILLLLS